MSEFWKDLATTIARYLKEDTEEEGTFENADRPIVPRQLPDLV
jgi:hypothetical protein